MSFLSLFFLVTSFLFFFVSRLFFLFSASIVVFLFPGSLLSLSLLVLSLCCGAVSDGFFLILVIVVYSFRCLLKTMSDGSSAKNGGSCAKEGGQSNRSLLLIPLICYTAVLLLYMLLLLLAVCCALFFIFLRAVLFPSFFPTVFSPFFFLFITWSINLLYFIVLLHMVWCAGWLLSCPLFFSSFFFSYFLFILFLLFYRTWSGVQAGLSFFFPPSCSLPLAFFIFDDLFYYLRTCLSRSPSLDVTQIQGH